MAFLLSTIEAINFLNNVSNILICHSFDHFIIYNRHISFIRNHFEGVRESIFFAIFRKSIANKNCRANEKIIEPIFLSACAKPECANLRDNKITRLRNFFEVASLAVVGIIPRILDPPRHPAAPAVGSFFIFTRDIYVAKINGWRKRVSGDTLLKIQPRATAAHQER